MENLIVSIIVPVYNTPQKKWDKCISSLISQSYELLEILIIDDGSQSETAKMLDDYKQKDNRIRIVHTSNQGLSMARNYGLKICSGSYCLFVDSDDVLSLTAVDTLISTLLSTNAQMVVGKLQVVSQYPNLKKSSEGQGYTIYEKDEALERLITVRGFGTTACGILASKEIWGEDPFIPGRFHEDLASVWKIFERCERIAVCHDTSYYYYYGDQSSIHTKKASEKLCFDFWKALVERSNEINKRHSNLAQAVSYSCLYYCPQIYCAIRGADQSAALEMLKKECIKLFRDCWKEGKQYKFVSRKELFKLHFFYLLPNAFYRVWRVKRAVCGIRM